MIVAGIAFGEDEVLPDWDRVLSPPSLISAVDGSRCLCFVENPSASGRGSLVSFLCLSVREWDPRVGSIAGLPVVNSWTL